MANMVGKYGYAVCDDNGDYLTVSTDIKEIYKYIADNDIRGDHGEYIREGTITEGNLVELEDVTEIDMNLFEFCLYAS